MVVLAVTKENKAKESSIKPISEHRVDNAQTYYYVNEIEIDGIRYMVLLDGTRAKMMFPKPNNIAERQEENIKHELRRGP